MSDNSLSVRADRTKEGPMPAYFKHLWQALADPWSPENPDGYTMAAVAENTVSADMLWERMESNKACTPAPIETMQYNDFKGLAELRKVFAELFERSTMRGIAVTSENLLLSAGVAAVIDNLFFCIADPGNVCLIPAPYYPMFDMDLHVRNEVVAWPLYFEEGSEDMARQLTAARRSVTLRGKSVRALLLTNPDNPTGKIYSEDQIRSILQWCCSNEVHCIVDEVYSLSVYGAEQPFRSVMVVASEWAEQQDPKLQDKLWQYLHVLLGVSKDFCMSGFRVGALYTYNQALIKAYATIAPFNGVSNLTQWELLCLFNDADFMDEFLVHNQQQLAQNCSILTEGLQRLGVPFQQPQGGLCVWMNLKEQVGIPDFDREREVLDLLFHEKIYVVNGEACHAQTPGYFRVCFSAHSADGIRTLVERLKRFLDRYKVTTARQNWDTQQFVAMAGGFGSRRM